MDDNRVDKVLATVNPSREPDFKQPIGSLGMR